MSLYNMVNGTEETAPDVLSMLGITPDAIPRFRDAYFKWAEDRKGKPTDVPIACIMTRTGGGNRPWYDNMESRQQQDSDAGRDGPWNDDLRALEGFIRDCDDNFDSTYAIFEFRVPESMIDTVKSFLGASGQPMSLQEKTEAFVAMLGGQPAKKRKG